MNATPADMAKPAKGKKKEEKEPEGLKPGSYPVRDIVFLRGKGSIEYYGNAALFVLMHDLAADKAQLRTIMAAARGEESAS